MTERSTRVRLLIALGYIWENGEGPRRLWCAGEIQAPYLACPSLRGWEVRTWAATSWAPATSEEAALERLADMIQRDLKKRSGQA